MKRKPQIKILSIALAILLIVQIMPFGIISFAEGNPYDVYDYVSYVYQFNNNVLNQIKPKLTKWEMYKRMPEGSLLYEIDYVNASFSSGFELYQDTNKNLAYSMADVYKTPAYPANLSYVIDLYSNNKAAWSAVFKHSDFSDINTTDPKAELVVGCTFVSDKGTLTLNGNTASGKGEVEVSAKIQDPSFGYRPTITVSGNAKTHATKFYAYIRDNNKASIESVEVKQEGSTLVINATATESLTFASENTLERYKDELFVTVKLNDARTGSGTTEMKAYLSNIGKTLQYRAELGEWAQKDYQILELKVNPLASITYTANVPLYDMSVGYWYVERNDTWRSYKTGFAIHKTEEVDASSTVITDRARNGLDISGINKTYTNLIFDNTTPKVSGIEIGVNGKELKSNISDNPNQWDEGVNLTDLYIGKGESISFIVTTDEKLKTTEDIKLPLNMQDGEGKQIVLTNPMVSSFSGGVYGVGQTVLTFNYKITSTDISMMSGHEGQRIRPMNITYTKAEDAAGHKLQIPNPLPAPAQQIYLDVNKPVIEVTQLESAENSGYVDVKIDVTDDGVGILSQNLYIDLSAVSEGATNFSYVIDTNQNRPANYTQKATLTGNSVANTSVTMHAKNDYTAYLHIRFDGAQTVENMTLKVRGVKDLLGNEADAVELKLNAKYDKIAPKTSIESIKVSYASDKAKVDGVFSASDYNQIAVKQYAWKTNSVTPSDNEWQTAAFSGNKGTVTTTIDNGENQTVYFWVRVQDNFGNWSTPIYKTISVQLQKPTTVVENRTESDKPVYNPEVIVSGPDKSSDGLTAYTRVTVTMGDNKYVRIVSTGESTNIFDFDGKWYQVTDNGTVYNSVTALNDTTALKNYYGEVTVNFENCYTDLTPSAGNTIKPANNGTYDKDPQTITVLYAPVQPEGISVHKVTFYNITDSVGNVIALPRDAQAHHFTKEMVTTRYNFSISNSLVEEWGVNDVNYEKSYIVFEKVDGEGNVLEEAVKITGISENKDQTFTVPAVKDNGEEFTIGAYRLKAVIYKNGSEKPEEYIDTSNIIVLDINQAETPYIWEYTIDSNEFFGGDSVYAKATEAGEITSLGMSFSMPYRNIYRDREIAVYTDGLEYFNLKIGSAAATETYYGITINETEGVRIWHEELNPTKEEIDSVPFHSTAGNVLETESGTVYYRMIWDYELVESIPELSEWDSHIYLKKGLNTFGIQTKNKNGTISETSYFTIYVTDNVPELDVSVDSFVPSIVDSNIEGQTNVESITYRINGVASDNSDENIRIKVLYTPEYGEESTLRVNGVLCTEMNNFDVVAEVKPGDLITVSKDCYSNNLSNFSSSALKLVTTRIVAVDSFGASVCVIPQLGEVNRDGYYTNYDYAVNSEAFWKDPWDDTAAERYYIDGSAYGTKYVSYRYYGFENSDKEEEIITTSDEDLTYNKYNIDNSRIDLGTPTKSNYQDGVSHIYQFGENIHLLDWENATIEITGDGIDGTVILPYNVSSPNEAGLVEFNDNYYSLTLRFANPISEDENAAELKRNYTIKVKDRKGNEFAFTEEYTNTPIHYADGGASLIDEIYFPEEGVRLYTVPYCSDGKTFIETGVFHDGLHEFTLTDAYGEEWPVAYEITGTDYEYEFIYSTRDYTLYPVTLTIKSNNANNIVNITDWDCGYGCECCTIENNGTNEVTVTATKYCDLYIEGYGYVTIDNIIETSYNVQWSIPDEALENGGEFAGTATVYLDSDEVYYGEAYYLIDRATGETPTFTFYPGGETSYTFKANDLAYVCGDEEFVFTEDVTVELPVTLVEAEPPTIRNEEGEVITDTADPEVQLVAYSEQKGFFIETDKVLQVIHSEEGIFSINPDYDIFKENTPLANTEEFVDAIGWGTGFRFDISIADMSDVKLFVKEGIYAEAPDYANGVSDEIEGVTLSGKKLKVSAPAAFTLFAVDENNYSTAIPMTLVNIGDAPIPGTVKVPADGEVRIYLVEPDFSGDETASELKIVPAGYDVFTDEDPTSEYYGYDYITVSQNGNYSISYSYIYNYDTEKEPYEVNGYLSVRVFEIRNEAIMLSGQVFWSSNANDTATNKSVTAKMKFTQDVTSVQAPSEYVDMLDVLISGTDVTVRYDENCPAVTLRIVGANATETVVDLGEVDNIDKAAPVISLVSKTLSEDGKKVTIVLSSDEKATLTKYNNQGENADGKYLYTDTVKANGTYTYSFIDAAGNFTGLETEVSNIIDTDLVMEYSLDITDNKTVDDPLELVLNLGDSIYVRVNRDATIDMNGEQTVNALAQQWVQLTVKESMAGLWPIIRAEDNYGNVIIGQLGQVKLPDTTAPVVDLIQDVIVVKVGTDASEIEKLLTENVVASDLDPNLTVKVQYNADLSVPCVVQVTYSVSDSSGNVGTDTGVLRIASNSEPTVKINGETVARDTIYVAKADKAIVLTVETEGEPYSVVYKNGIKSAGQMKIDVTDVVTDAVTDDEITLPFSESGYYTVCIKTQSRDYYIFQIYAE